MPLHDHFDEPLRRARPWEMVHSGWANAIATQLNTVLPGGYFAGAEVHWGREIEIDVATSRDEGIARDLVESGNGGAVVASPPVPGIRAPLDTAEHDLVEVRVYREADGLELVAAVELVSPANKDRPDQRDAFASKCAGYVARGVSVVIVDIVTSRAANLHADVLDRLRVSADLGTDFGLYAVAYRADEEDAIDFVEAWPEELRIGEPLPTLPLWIGPDLSVPLDLEAAYVTTCRSLRIRV